MKVCFVGTGSIGKRHIKNWSELCVQKNEKLIIHLLRHSNIELPSDIKELIAKQIMRIEDLDMMYDAVFICNPTYLHYETIKALKNHSKFFFVEKPVFDTGGLELDSLQLPKENIYYVACPLRYTGVLQHATQIAKNERVLSVRAISSSYLPDWRPGVDYRNTYSAHKSEGGGVMIDLIHEWDYLVSMFGTPVEIKNMYGKFSNLEIDSEDIAIYIAKYEDKLIELHLDYLGRKTRRTLELRTDNNEYVFDICENKVMKNGILMNQYTECINDRYKREMEYFWLLIHGKEKSVNDLSQALSVLKIALGNA